MSEFLAMGGYAWYVWMSYGAAAVAVIVEVAALRMRRRRRHGARIDRKQIASGRQYIASPAIG